ncbi:MAG: nitrate reductase molybdenum cofactor assembly chaperone [Betaproteobacteria bacterium]|nr:nitrate reductase molybdenum cofactor assembly chaperone [Betaproteobacteria bacterium]
MFHRMLSKMLDYPDEGLLGVAWEIRERGRHAEGLAPSERQAVAEFMDFVESMSLTELQGHYVMTFDLTPEHSLHLTHHVFGDDKNRGPALIDLTEYYKAYGLELPVKEAANDEDNPNELPDFLPLMLEFAGQLEPEEGRVFLSQWSKVLNQLAANLEEAKSPYAALVRLIEQRSLLIQAAA